MASDFRTGWAGIGAELQDNRGLDCPDRIEIFRNWASFAFRLKKWQNNDNHPGGFVKIVSCIRMLLFVFYEAVIFIGFRMHIG